MVQTDNAAETLGASLEERRGRLLEVARVHERSLSAEGAGGLGPSSGGAGPAATAGVLVERLTRRRAEGARPVAALPTFEVEEQRPPPRCRAAAPYHSCHH